MADDRITLGFGELDREFATLPNRLADELQGAIVRMMLDHKREVVRVSTFSAQGKRGLARALRIRPEPTKAAQRSRTRRIADVVGESYSVWKGDTDVPPSQGIARRLERTVGAPFHTPIQARYLLLPVGDLLTPTGRPRKRAGKQVRVRDLPDVTFVKMRRGLVAIQELDPGKRGLFESGLKGIRATKLGARTRIVGVLTKRAKATQGIDFWGSWQRLEGKRKDRFRRVLNAVTDKGKAQRR